MSTFDINGVHSQADSDNNLFKTGKSKLYNKLFKSQRIVKSSLQDRINEMIQRVSKKVSKRDKLRMSMMLKKIKD